MNKTLILALTLSIIGIITQRLFGLHNMLLQFVYTLVAFIIYRVILFAHAPTLLRIAKLAAYTGITALLLLLVIGDPTRGSKRWFFLFGFGLQPSMLFLPFFLLYFSILLEKIKLDILVNLIKMLTFIFLPAFLIFKQPDLGTSIIIALSACMMVLYTGIQLRHVAYGALVTAPFILLLPKFLKPYQVERIVSFLNPQHDTAGINYNSMQALIALGSGGLWGKGFLQATQSKLYFLPEAHTDFVFAAFTETFGFIGAVLLVVVYFLFLRSIIQNIDKAPYLFRVYSIGVFAYIFVQFVFNIGMNLRLLPVVGIPLPLISDGGSAIVTMYMLLAILEKLKHV